MKLYEDMTAYWSSMNVCDLVTIMWIVIMVALTLAINIMFAGFIQSKPSGRKTVIGKFLSRNFTKL
jgi:hypothetical protein